jgi:hypothetical protein
MHSFDESGNSEKIDDCELPPRWDRSIYAKLIGRCSVSPINLQTRRRNRGTDELGAMVNTITSLLEA